MPVYPIRQEMSNPLPPKKPRILRTFKELVMEETALEFIVDGLFPDAGWTLLVGLPGVGKSTFAAQLCSSLEEGTSFLGMKTVKRHCLYIQCDTPTDLWRAQLKRIAPNSEALTLVNVPQAALDSEQYVEIIEKMIAFSQPGFVVFDALNSLTAMDINTKQALKPIYCMNRLARLKVEHNEEPMFKDLPWMLLHHPKKGIEKGVHSSSGFGGISGACATHVTLSHNKLKIEKGKVSARRSIGLSKDRNGLWYIEPGIEDDELAGMDIRY